MTLSFRCAGLVSTLGVLTACGGGSKNPAPASKFDKEALLDPQSCESCHPGQYEEWSGSMHAYSSVDPVFVAMNARGQEETDGRLGTFCVNCHAPMALREGMTSDGLNLDELESKYLGVTCYFCHSVEKVEGVHNNPLVLSDDATLHGPFDDPLANPTHESAYSRHFDPKEPAAAALCGSCHDVMLTEDLNGHEVRLERTYDEWQDTLFARPYDEGGVGCNACHMPYSPRRTHGTEIAGAPERRSARHDFEGVDLALVRFPNRERQRLLAERLLASSLLAEICVAETGAIEVTLENSGSGHNWPSGASHDREAWLELRAFSADDDEPLFETVPPESQDENAVRVVLRDHVVDGDGKPAHMFWDVAELADSTTLPGVATRDPLDPEYHRERRVWTFNQDSASLSPIDRVTLTVRIRPIGLSILEDLVDSGHLDASYVEAMPVLDLLPNRCHDDELVNAYPDILVGSQAACDDAEVSDHTLVWRDSEANEANRAFRVSRVTGVPARCLSHPTYVSVPTSQ